VGPYAEQNREKHPGFTECPAGFREDDQIQLNDTTGQLMRPIRWNEKGVENSASTPFSYVLIRRIIEIGGACKVGGFVAGGKEFYLKRISICA